MPPRYSAADWPSGSSEMARRIREHGWAATPLGPSQGWPQSLRTLVDVMLTANQPMFIAWEPDRRVIYNDAYAKILADKHPDALGRDFLDVWHEIRAELAPIVEQAYKGEPVQMDDIPLHMERKGYPEEAHFAFFLTPVRVETGAIIGFFCACQEITGKVLAERLVQESEARLRSVLDGMGEAFSLLDRDFRILTFNEAALRLETRPLEEIVGRSHWEVYPGSEDSEVGRLYKRALAEQQSVALEHHYTWEDGTARWLEMRAFPVPEGLAVFWRDISERKRAEEATRESEERLRAILETALDYAVFTMDAEGRIETWSRGAEEVLGWPADEIVGHSADITFTPEDRASGVPERERRTAREQGLASDVRWHLRRDGTRVFVEGAMRPLTDADGSLTGFVKVGQDVTERRRAEERLQLATEAARLGIFDADLTTGEIEWDARMRELWGAGPDEVVTDEEFLSGIHPDDLETARAAIGHALDPEGDRLYRAEYRIRRRGDGRECWIAARGRVHFDGPRPVRLVGTVQDITEQKKAEAALRESEERFRQFGEASADVLWIRDAETLAFEYVSPAFEELYGAPFDSILGRNHVRGWLEMILPEDRTAALDHLRRARKGEHVLHAFRILRSDGQVRWIRDTSFPILDEEGRVQRIGGIGHDATEEIELQDRLKVLVAELQHRTRNLVGVVRALADKTLAGSHSLEDFEGRFRDRLRALARVNSLLSRLEEGDRITFDRLLQAELSAHGVVDAGGKGDQVRLSGPEGIRLRSSTVQTFALALHELATNALKYGALSRPEGRLGVRWDLVDGMDDEQRLRVEWRESGVPVAQPDGASTDEAAPTRRRGYGRELIERALPYQLQAETSYELTPEGVRCTITLPISTSMSETALDREGTNA